ncbi:hypothetical protein GALL_115370 [mine drainage metagenome]|uniref:Protein containing DUF1814 n=1 Tax=mine drainage metagenome TaxID=410659 RepID=A0A1J5SEI7_9ZZZZ
MDRTYVETVRLMLEIAPEVFASGKFALKGGTALNLFVRNMPRLSIDIDAVFMDHTGTRAAALGLMANELTSIRLGLERRGIVTDASARNAAEETKLFARRGKIEVKVEVNHVFRGILLPTERRPLVKSAADQFTVHVEVPTLAIPELYGSKLVAAMDRQHPRDFFDIHGLYQQGGLTPTIVDCFVAYLAGHNRPVHEVLFSRDVDMTVPFQNEFEGMQREPVTLAQLNEARIRLRRDLLASLNDDHKRFLLGLVAGNPPWDALPFVHLSELPAIRWKLQNLERLKKLNVARFQAQTDELQKRLGG